MASKSALRRDPSKPPTGGGLTQSLRRVSPGIYRDAGGRLTNQAGRPMPQQPNRQQYPMEWQLQAPSSMAPMQRPMGPAMDSGFFSNEGVGQPGMVNLPAQYAPGQDMGAVLSGIAGQGNMALGSQDMMYQPSGYGANAAQMPQPSANNGGKYRLSPGVYGTREQAMRQMYQPIPGLQNGLGQQGYMPPIDWNQMVNYPASMPQQPQQQQQMPTRQQMLRKY